MSEKKKNIHLIDPLSDVTRRERKYLLGISLLGIAIAEIGIIPTQINALGIELASADQNAFLTLIIAVIIYFACAFVIYAWSDFVAWRSDILNFYANNTKEFFDNIESHVMGQRHPSEAEVEAAYDRVRFWNNIALPTAAVRALFEFVLPAIVAGYSIFKIYNELAIGT